MASQTIAPAHLAFDLGAASGRAIVGTYRNDRLVLEEVHRFPNYGVQLPSGLHWDLLHIWQELQVGLRKALSTANDSLQSIGVDTWGVDYGLLAADGSLLGNPYHYRDRRTDGILEKVFSRISRADVYHRTGIQFMQLNSLFQLYSMVEDGSPLLTVADQFLNIPDLLNFWLSGERVSEFTIATTTQCYNPWLAGWDTELLSQLEIPSHLFGEIVPPGTKLGPLRRQIQVDCDAPPLSVVASAGHDTACAVAAVPASGSDFIYLSSGTWSLLGIELHEPLINTGSMEANVTNEGGVGGTYRFLKNIAGLWLIQECLREWQRHDPDQSYEALTQLAADSPSFQAMILTNDPCFLAPGNMPSRIQAFCQQTGQYAPQSEGEIVRCALESLAFEYRAVVDQLEALAGKALPVIHIIGGGAQNRLLNQFTADATRRPVIAGPVEATAAGNLLVQLMALGQIDSLAAGRALIRRSFTLETYEPGSSGRWEQAYERYQDLKAAVERGEHRIE